MFCKNCGAEVNENQDVCTNCGCKVTNEEKKDSKLGGQDKIVMILICLFLGGLGVHNFMMGETKKGVVRLVASCCCGLGCILALIDLIKIATDSYTVDKDAYI